MPAECSPESFELEAVESRAVVASFNGSTVTSNAGALALRQVVRQAYGFDLWGPEPTGTLALLGIDDTAAELHGIGFREWPARPADHQQRPGLTVSVV